MPTYIYEFRIWLEILPPIALASTVTLLLLLLSREFSQRRVDSFLVVFSMGFLGVVAGLVTGQSRDPAVGTVLPAVLSLIGALTLYLIAAKAAGQQKLTAIVVIAFVVDFLVGVHWGAHSRDQYEAYITSEEVLIFQEKVKQNIRLQQLLHEKQLIQARDALGMKPRVGELHDVN